MADSLINNSILISTKKKIGITEEYTHFDSDLVDFINGVFFTLRQLGVGPTNGFRIESAEETWDDYVPAGPVQDQVKLYVYAKVRIAFDPPASSFVMTGLQDQIKEAEWRLNVAVDPAEQ